jgi:predicted oxidoreductase
MQKVQWPELDLALSKLAFGCAPIMGRVGKRVARNAMAMAFERGVTHFDLARSYGFGEAERVVGGFIADKRDRVTIATKFGIQPSRLSNAARRLKPSVRFVRQWLPSLAGLVRNASRTTLARGRYGLDDAQLSVETSLRELRVDAVDILFIHDCTSVDDLQPELLTFFERLKQEGKIKTWGLATHAEHIAPVARKLFCPPPVVQFPWRFDASSFADPPRRILHSPITWSKLLRNADGGLPPQLVDWGRGNGISPAELSRRLPTLALQAAAVSAPQAVILCSMFMQSNVLSNTQALENLQLPLASDFARVTRAFLEQIR